MLSNSNFSLFKTPEVKPQEDFMVATVKKRSDELAKPFLNNIDAICNKFQVLGTNRLSEAYMKYWKSTILTPESGNFLTQFYQIRGTYLGEARSYNQFLGRNSNGSLNVDPKNDLWNLQNPSNTGIFFTDRDYSDRYSEINRIESLINARVQEYTLKLKESVTNKYFHQVWNEMLEIQAASTGFQGRSP